MMIPLTTEQRARVREAAMADAANAGLTPAERNNALVIRTLLDDLEMAEAQRADVLAFLRQPQLLLMPGRYPVTHSEGCWGWHTECLATEIRRMLGDER